MRSFVVSISLVSVAALSACDRSPVEPPVANADSPAVEEAAAPAPEGSAAPADEGSAAPAEDGSAQAEPAPPAEPVDPDQALRDAIAGHGRIDGPVRDLIWGVTEDDVPEMLNATREDLENRHYLTCDELNLHLWYERVNGIGGAYAGVGSDQAYTFIGWMRPQIAWLTDYDPWVRTVHKIYAVAFEGAETIDEFRAFWSEDQASESWAAIEAKWADDRDWRFMRPVWDGWRYRINRRLRRYQDVLEDAEVPSFLTDQETYDFVRDFVASGRVRPLLANLLDDTALREIGDVSRRLDVPIRVFYLSNAEDYWRYPDEFRENFQQLHFDEQSYIVRTNAAKRTNGDYRYCMQPALNFQRWLQQDYVTRIDDIWEHPYIQDENHIPSTFLDEEPFDRSE